MNRIVKTMVRSYKVAGEDFLIGMDVYGEFWGLNKKDFDENGKSIKEYNEITGNHGYTIEDTMRKCYLSARVTNELDFELFYLNDID